MRLLPAAKPVPAASPWIVLTTSYDSFFFPENRRESVLGRPGIYLRRRTCVSSAKAYNAGAGLSKDGWSQDSSLCSGDCSHLGRQTESETSPLTPKTSLSKIFEYFKIRFFWMKVPLL